VFREIDRHVGVCSDSCIRSLDDETCRYASPYPGRSCILKSPNASIPVFTCYPERTNASSEVDSMSLEPENQVRSKNGSER
jgi:hypothetical protein